MKIENHPRDVHDAESSSAGQTNGTCRRPPRISCFFGGLLDKPQNLQAVCIVAAPFLGERDAACGSAEKRDPHGRLQLIDMAGYRRLTKAKLSRSSRQTTTFYNPDERPHPIQGKALIIHFLAKSGSLPLIN
ncbi:hypothetical protein FHT73_000973 [Rhizobium sp. BK098]|nr:hypothetical protein [Rhizobium sp. BK098]